MKNEIKKILYRNLQLLNDSESDRVQVFILWLKAKRIYNRSPRFARLAYWYVPTTFATLIAFPPASTLPPVALPIAAASSFCLAYILSAFIGLKI